MSDNRRRGAASFSDMKDSMGSLKRSMKEYYKCFPKLMPVVYIVIILAALPNDLQPLIMQKVYKLIDEWFQTGDWMGAKEHIMPYIILLIVLYVIGIILSTVQAQMLAFMTQRFLDYMRREMFGRMQRLPISYFDTNKHGFIMSHFTNDIDTLRQLVSQVIPTVLQAGLAVVIVFVEMLYFSVWMTLVIVAGIVIMTLITGRVGAGSSKYFVRQQNSVAATEGYVQEMMNGQKVVKVFNHEDEANEAFDKLNEELCSDATKANAYANILGPIINNVGNIMYVLIAVVGGILVYYKVPNLSLSGIVFEVSIVATFLNMSKKFMANLNQLTMQMNAIVMAAAGAGRIFNLMDTEPETDDGYVTLVNAEIDSEGNITEVDHHTGKWAWKHPHKAEGTITYQELKGDVVMDMVDFSYVPGKQVLTDISLFAKPGQKVAFVGATGAGKTTITNLINRFYDIEDGKIRYDGINVNKIVKKDLRQSLGLVLQETNLFTGTVMDNIRYGKLDASDEECIEAAKLAGADGFIERLPEGYNTMLDNNGANLSQGQRQLIAIARAAVADPPVMILDEATSSIDTRTEAIVARGMDKLMEGRTVFVIAHRLSTVKNSDVIMVLDHGKIIERGSHDQLIAEKGTYYRLYTGAFELE
ncbi:ATP-binding cassette, subfamily B [Ruminococcaceae bacterium YRB3002]|nr:ATP-binding cassette, subfamily B [Ruminococcaceae bacterium YRB3002]